MARAGPGSAPPLLEGEGWRRRSLVLEALGALGETLPHPGAPPPLAGLGQELGTEQVGEGLKAMGLKGVGAGLGLGRGLRSGRGRNGLKEKMLRSGHGAREGGVWEGGGA